MFTEFILFYHICHCMRIWPINLISTPPNAVHFPTLVSEYSSSVPCMKAIHCILIKTLLKILTRVSNNPAGNESFK